MDIEYYTLQAENVRWLPANFTCDPYHMRYGRGILPHYAEVPIGPMHELIGESSSVERGAVVARPGSISPTVRSNFQSFVTAVGASLTVIAVRGARAVDIH